MKHEHKFQRLSDEAIFCGCGEIRTATPPPIHSCGCSHWHVYPYVPPTVYPYTPTYPTWIVTSGSVTTGDVSIGSTFDALGHDENVTYTLTSGAAS